MHLLSELVPWGLGALATVLSVWWVGRVLQAGERARLETWRFADAMLNLDRERQSLAEFDAQLTQVLEEEP